jgi:nicotinate phosphoribosyltransferase
MIYHNLSLLTDFYELTMMQGYFFKFPDEEGVFEMFYRYQPFNGGYSIFAGLDPLLDAIEKIKFSDDDLRYLESQALFKKEFIDYLSGFSFKGDIYSVREGSVVFPNEPLIRVSGNLMETQLIESIVLNFVNFQTLIATKTARMADTAGDTRIRAQKSAGH